ncbi:MAG: arginine N-succinyltransferase [Phycisphaeraceae bacterium]
MLIIRPVRLTDVDALVELTELTGFGLTTLPRDRALLERRVRDACRAFDHLDDDIPHGQNYLFIMHEPGSDQIVGTAGVTSKVGGYEPFYAYRIESELHESATLNVRKNIQTLHLLREHDGPCEVGSLFLHPGYRRDGNGRALSLARFLFMAEHPTRFDPRVIAELRGVIDHLGHSPFWDAVGKHFFDIDLLTADYLSIVDKQFIADLMPRHPIYIPMLPPQAQAVIGQCHDETAPARALLEQEGFTFSHMVDIFEAGPIVEAPRDEIRTIRASRLGIVQAIVQTPADDAPMHLLATVGRDFLALHTPLSHTHDGGLALPRAAGEALGVTPGDTLRYVPLRPAIQPPSG